MRTAGRVLWMTVGVVALFVAGPPSGWCAHSSLTFYGGLFGNKEYVHGWEGIAGAIGVHEHVSVLGRVTGVHVIDSEDDGEFRAGHSGIAEGGFAFHIAPNTTLSVLGGSYFGEIFDPIIDGAISTAQNIGGRWFYLSVGGLYGFESNRWQNTIYLSTPITDPQEDLVLFGGVESLIYNEGQLRSGDDFIKNDDSRDVRVQVGPVIEFFKRSWDAGLRLGVGGGDFGIYGTMSIYKRFTLSS